MPALAKGTMDRRPPDMEHHNPFMASLTEQHPMATTCKSSGNYLESAN